MSIATVQDKLTPNEDLEPFEGEWVILRDGLVVAHGKNVFELRKEFAADADHLLMLVPEDGTQIQVL